MSDPITKAFSFRADERTFTCRIETSRAGGGWSWWWFSVSGDGQRYAPFVVAEGDTLESVTTRVLGYYRALVARRSLPLDAQSSMQLRRDNLAALKRTT